MSEIIFMIKCKKCKSVFNQGERTAVRLCEKCRVKNKNGVKKQKRCKKKTCNEKRNEDNNRQV
jgi:hypothetical protein